MQTDSSDLIRAQILSASRPQLNRVVAGWRMLHVGVHIAYGLLLATLYPACSWSAQRRLMRHWMRGLLGILRIGLETRGDFPVMPQSRMFVANHISWLDPMLIGAVTPACFVAKSEVGAWPLLGWLCRRVDTLFIRRDVRRDAMSASNQIAALLRQGEFVVIFPEGTTTTGRETAHFHSSLLQGAVDARAAIQPVAIRFHDDNGHPNEDAAYVGDMSFVQSLWKILRSPALYATLIYLPVLPASDNRRMLAAQAREAIDEALKA
ncbi:MAG: 1-acyl-sn-glycerol-3-phosphate acyltransferase [Gallionellaceae bacterium]|jgi:1-acyl-sn-glycerol-3-phosphate acyltransferase|nr:1-acyl-sn-glycerol-3-phosphate acyltransferase [Gallionellaceae bacterium]